MFTRIVNIFLDFLCGVKLRVINFNDIYTNNYLKLCLLGKRITTLAPESIYIMNNI